MFRLSPKAGRSKFGAVPVVVDGQKFASKAEGRRYSLLRIQARVGAIQNLQLHPTFELTVNGVKVGLYIADASYYRSDGEYVVEDTKGGPSTPIFRLKKRMVRAQYGIEIMEIR